MEIIILKQQGHVKNKVEIKFFVLCLTYSQSSLNVGAVWQGGDDDGGGGDVAALPPLHPTALGEATDDTYRGGVSSASCGQNTMK